MAAGEGEMVGATGIRWRTVGDLVRWKASLIYAPRDTTTRLSGDTLGAMSMYRSAHVTVSSGARTGTATGSTPGEQIGGGGGFGRRLREHLQEHKPEPSAAEGRGYDGSKSDHKSVHAPTTR